MDDARVAPPWAEDAFRDEPAAFDFEQAVRLLQRLHADRAGPGEFVDPAREAVRFSAHPSLAFPPSAIEELEPPAGSSDPYRMVVNFFGLVGPRGVLPHEYTRLVADRLRAKDGSMAAFLDLFNHRAVSLLYRAWQASRFDVQRELGGEDVLTGHLLDLAGAGAPVPNADPDLPDEVVVGFAGLIAAQPRGVAALQQWIGGVFGVPVEVVPFVGGWFTLEEEARTHLDAGDDATRLGAGAIIGDEVWDPHARVLIRLGPMDLATYRSFLPGARAHVRLAALARFFARDPIEFDLELMLEGDDVPLPVLGSAPTGGFHGDEGDDAGVGDSPLRLGWTTWLPQASPRAPVSDTRLRLGVTPSDARTIPLTSSPSAEGHPR